MRKIRTIVGLVLVAAMVFAAGIGSAAYFSRTYQTANNTVKADDFTLTVFGMDTSATSYFNVSGFAPGDSGKHLLSVLRTTDLPVNYDVYVTSSGLPLTFSLIDNKGQTLNFDGDGKIYDIPCLTNTKWDSLYLVYSWNDTADDNSYIGATGSVAVTVVAKQQHHNTANGTALGYVKYLPVTVYDAVAGTYTHTDARVTIRYGADGNNLVVGDITDLDINAANCGHITMFGNNNFTNLGKLDDIFTSLVMTDRGVDVNGNYCFKGTMKNTTLEIDVTPLN